MPKLNEYIGSLVSSVTSARMMSDIQTVKVAEEYAKHDLLKHFSIPRLRIDEIEMTIPIALDKIEETPHPFEPINSVEFNSVVYNKLINILGFSKLPGEISRNVRSEISKLTKTLDQNIRLTKNLTPLKIFARELTAKILGLKKQYPYVERDLKTEIEIEALPEHLEKILLPEIKSAPQNFADLNVIVEAHRLREQKPENIIQIKLKISEEGLEWDKMETAEGKIEKKLLPE